MKTENKLRSKSTLALGKYVSINVRSLLAERDMTRKDLADLMGAPSATVYGILDDPNRIKVNHVEIFSKLLGVPVEELFKKPRSADGRRRV